VESGTLSGEVGIPLDKRAKLIHHEIEEVDNLL